MENILADQKYGKWKLIYGWHREFYDTRRFVCGICTEDFAWVDARLIYKSGGKSFDPFHPFTRLWLAPSWLAVRTYLAWEGAQDDTLCGLSSRVSFINRMPLCKSCQSPANRPTQTSMVSSMFTGSLIIYLCEARMHELGRCSCPHPFCSIPVLRHGSIRLCCAVPIITKYYQHDSLKLWQSRQCAQTNLTLGFTSFCRLINKHLLASANVADPVSERIRLDLVLLIFSCPEAGTMRSDSATYSSRVLQVHSDGLRYGSPCSALCGSQY